MFKHLYKGVGCDRLEQITNMRLFSRSLLCKVRLNIKKCLSVCLSVCPKTICLMIMFHHSLYSHYNSRKPYLNKKRPVAQNGIFFKNVFNRKYFKFNLNIMSKIVFWKY